MLPTLTNREEQILRLIARGLTNREISSDLSISESTVENHIHKIYTKLGISNRAQAVAHALQLKIVLRDGVLIIEGILHDKSPSAEYNICEACPFKAI